MDSEIEKIPFAIPALKQRKAKLQQQQPTVQEIFIMGEFTPPNFVV